MTQPVLIKSFKDEFEKLPNKNFVTPAIPNTVLQKTKISPDNASLWKMPIYRKGVGKLLHLMRWSRPDILNATREVSRYMSEAIHAHFDALYRLMDYCVDTKNRGLVLKPTG